MASADLLGREAPAEGGEPIPLSALQHAVYCPRQAALIHLERMWAENRFTAEGDILHITADRPGQRRVRGMRRVFSLPLASKRLGLAGVADLVEFHATEDGREVPLPVEYKRGKPKAHRADEVQLCAQALCLEEMLGRPVPEGALFYGETRRRVAVTFDTGLRAVTEETAAELRTIFAEHVTPAPTPHKSRCRACSLAELCRPTAVVRSAGAWTRQRLADLLAEVPGNAG
ncbi:CRISPR-associated protein Cas4 [Afifella sp. H1R]|uniref:CRISPR-associated protein Cas4 n=1 Tax=Afifella sp. H1R TaxID=2908841 RepID=UPI001F15DDF2|nr:CRISPR-associated protein Cas4 [Afifella sp. H1R]MCF1503201.1 CRISPR-associated protein Cas4 [Afifella sp. H1R]